MKSASVEDRPELYELLPDDSYDNYIEASHRWGLPGVRCEACGATWGNAGVAYPTADLSSLPNSQRYTSLWPVPWTEFEGLRAAVLPLLPAGALAPPGTDLGPLVGRARGTFPELVWQNPWTILAHSDVILRLSEKGVRRLVGAVAQLTGRRQLPQLVELQLEPHGCMSPSSLPFGGAPPCTTCGRRGITRPSQVIIDRCSIPMDHDIFRLTDLTTMIVATTGAVNALRDLGLRGFRFQEVALSS